MIWINSLASLRAGAVERAVFILRGLLTRDHIPLFPNCSVRLQGSKELMQHFKGRGSEKEKERVKESKEMIDKEEGKDRERGWKKWKIE